MRRVVGLAGVGILKMVATDVTTAGPTHTETANPEDRALRDAVTGALRGLRTPSVVAPNAQDTAYGCGTRDRSGFSAGFR